jgi:hypothetical protein
MQSAEKKSELSTKLREICAEIESKDGRKIELIKRVIISRFKKGTCTYAHSCVANTYLHVVVQWHSQVGLGGSSTPLCSRPSQHSP